MLHAFTQVQIRGQMPAMKWPKIHSQMGERKTRWLNNLEKNTYHTKHAYRVTLKGAYKVKKSSSLQENETEPQREDTHDFPPTVVRIGRAILIPSPNCEKGLLHFLCSSGNQIFALKSTDIRYKLSALIHFIFLATSFPLSKVCSLFDGAKIQR